ncbi:dehydrogenase [Gloeopeniophorella convolvens]|nr:dehydrogenase [Gloeopeniophorella convolvens]
MTPPLKHKTVIIGDGAAILAQVDVPRPGPGEVLIKVIAAAANPFDWQTVSVAARTGLIGNALGLEFAGVIEVIGAGVPAGLWRIGESVCGFVHAGQSSAGAFSEYVVANASLGIIRIPTGWSFEDAAQLGVSGFSALLCLHDLHSMHPIPAASPSTGLQPLFVHGASSAIGLYAIQFAKLAGRRVVATASRRDFELVRSFGADAVFDCQDPQVVPKVRAAAGCPIWHAIDTISDFSSTEVVSNALTGEGGAIAATAQYRHLKRGLKLRASPVYSLLGKDFNFPMHYTLTAEDRERGPRFGKLLSDILATGKVRPIPLLILSHGLASVNDGTSLVKLGNELVSGKIVTYRISDTPA